MFALKEVDVSASAIYLLPKYLLVINLFGLGEQPISIFSISFCLASN